MSLYQRFPTVLNAAVNGPHVVYTELLPLMVSVAQGKVETDTWGDVGQLWRELIILEASVSR